MSTTQPIRNKRQLKEFKDYYREQRPDLRNYALITISLNTALRISDILHLTRDMVYNGGQVRSHIVVRERKTGKENRILLNDRVREALNVYYSDLTNTRMYRAGNPYLFPSPRCVDQPLSRFQAYRIISDAADAVGIEGKISCHSMRKTFGYHAWKQGNDPLIIMLIFNHSSINITKRYLCLDQDDKDAVFREVYL